MFLKAALKLALLFVLQICPTLASDCGPPPDQENAIYTASGYAIGNWVHYACDEGYILYGRNRILCTRKGWSKTTMSCQKIMCDHPPIISHGTVTQGEEWTYGAEAIYSCDKGYTLTGQETIHCMDSGAWSHPPPNCTASDCGPPPDQENATYTATGYTIGKWAFYTCNKGYILYGRNRILCTRKGWSKTTMSCQKIMCDHPPIISHGTVTQGEEWTYGAEAIYSCDKGYTLTGQETIHCMDSGAWSHPPPNCTVQCERPRNLNNAIIYPDQHIYYYEDHVTFSCLPGYILMGSIGSVCVGRDTFDPPPPTCKKVQCERPRNLNNAIIYPDQHIYYYEDHVTFSCLPGYILMGSIGSVCVGRDTFDPPPPTCKKDNSEWTISKTARGKINTIIQWSHEIINEKKDINQMEHRLLQKKESILLKYQAIVQNLEILLNRTSIPKAA